MITPRATRLVRAEHLPALHRALLSLATRGDLGAVRRRAIVVPSRAAAQQLRQTLETLWFDLQPAGRDAALVLPDLLTRADWYQRLHERAGIAEPMLTPLEREVLLGAAARDAIDAGSAAAVPAAARADRRDARRSTTRCAASSGPSTRSSGSSPAELEPRTEIDRGAERLLRQTRFLVAAFRAFERRVAASGKLDEQGLRRTAAGRPEPTAVRGDGRLHALVVTVGDRTSEPAGGLYPADIDLLDAAARRRDDPPRGDAGRSWRPAWANGCTT